MPDVQLDHQCSQCGAVNRQGTKRCWLCGADLGTPVVYAELVPDSPQVGGWQFTLSELMIVVTLAAVIFGTWVQNRGTGMFLLIFFALPVLVAFVRSAQRRSRGQDVTWTAKLQTFLISAAAAIGVLVMLCVAAICAMFVYCLFNPIRF